MRLATAVGFIVLAGCGYESSDGVTYPSGTPASVSISATSTEPMTSTGDTLSLTAVVTSASGSVITAPLVAWRTSAPSVATVAGSGASATVTAVDDGTAVITAASGSTEGTITVTVRRRLVSIELTGPDSVVVAGDSTQLT